MERTTRIKHFTYSKINVAAQCRDKRERFGKLETHFDYPNLTDSTVSQTGKPSGAIANKLKVRGFKFLLAILSIKILFSIKLWVGN